jgi:glycosyltransferase involved in cell wall biosynthesis
MAVRPRLKRFVKSHVIEGRLRSLSARVHDALVEQEVLLERMLDSFAFRAEGDKALLPELTAMIKTFERPLIVRRLVASIRRLYPGMSIIVVDDSREPVALEGAEIVAMPYDSGIAAGRNEGLRHVSTKYVLVLDDDYVFSRQTRLNDALTLMERFPEIDIMGGQLVDLPLFTSRPLREVAGSIFPTDAEARTPIGSSIGGLTVCEKVPTFFIGRTERIALVSWDPALKRIDHGDFFTRAFGVLTTTFNPHLKCFHARTPFDDTYMAKRLDLEASRKILEERYYGRAS